ncbi:MAG: serine hydrolase [Proteobacteria bacterium]|nr:serine hydrolase [Pseudomonadota bacterium]
MSQTPDLDQIARAACEKASAEYGLEVEKLAATIHVHDRDARTWAHGSHQGARKFYPASVVKVFFLAYAMHLIEQKKLELTDELQRGFDDMIGYSSNDATNYVLEVITGTGSGPNVSDDELKEFMQKREAPNRWYASLGYKDVYAVQKTWYDGPYGRDRQAYGLNWEHRNSLTTDATARWMSDVMLDKFVTPDKCADMRKLLSRTILADDEKASKSYIGGVLPSGTKLWSKAGWTSDVRHDLACVRTKDGKEITLCIYTEYGRNTKAVSFIAAEILRSLGVDAKMPDDGEPVWLPEDQQI